MTHGYALKGRVAGEKGDARQRGAKGKNWSNSNSIIIKYTLEKKINELTSKQTKGLLLLQLQYLHLLVVI